jgi:hypothetical protein
LKCVDIALPSSKNTLACCENEFIGNTYIYKPQAKLFVPIKGNVHYENNKNNNNYIKMANPSLKSLWHGQYVHISQQKIIVSHVICEIPHNTRKLVH